MSWIGKISGDDFEKMLENRGRNLVESTLERLSKNYRRFGSVQDRIEARASVKMLRWQERSRTLSRNIQLSINGGRFSCVVCE